MAPVRRLARASSSASVSSSPANLPTPTLSGPQLQSTSNAEPHISVHQTPTAAPRVLQHPSTSPSKPHGSNSFDAPIILSDTETDNGTAGIVQHTGSSDEDMTAPHRTAGVDNGKAQRLSLLFPAITDNHQDESRSSTTLDRSYATSLNSEVNLISDGSLSSLSSIDSDSDVTDDSDNKSIAAAISSLRSTPRQTHNKTPALLSKRGTEATPEATASSSSSSSTPSRRSARIVSSGSSIQKALQRRDDLDAKLLASPLRRKPDSPEAPPPPRRAVGRPRKSVQPVPAQSFAARLSTSPAVLPSSVQNLASPSSTRRSARLSLPFPMAPNSEYPASKDASQSPRREAELGPRPELRPGKHSRKFAEASDKSKPVITLQPFSDSVTFSASVGSAISNGPVGNSPAVTSDAQSIPTLPVERSRGRPRKSQPGLPTFPQTPAALTAEREQPALVTRLRKRNLSTAGMTAKSESLAVDEQQEDSDFPPRKRGRPARSSTSATDRTAGEPLSTASGQTLHGRTPLRIDVIDLLDDDLSELSDASDMSLNSSQPHQSASQSIQSGESHRQRPPQASTLPSKKLKRASKQNKDGKIYHYTGLYAGEADAVASTSSLYPDASQSTLLPYPIHFGAKLLTEERDFCLPYPIHQTMDQLRDRVNAKRKPPRYQQINKNKYVTRAKLQGEVPLCNCKPGSGCGHDCINRMLMFICDPKTCPSASNCTNISLGRRPHVKTAVAYYGRRGFGLKTLEAIKRDDFIDEYRGEVINLSEAAKRVTEEYKATGNYYLLDYDSAAGELLDGGRKGNITRFANHSCDPNCRIEKFIICGTDEALSAEFQIGLFANRDIAAGEELTYNYGWAAFQPRDITGAPTAQVPTEQCLCGAANCSGILGGKKAPVSKSAADAVAANTRKKTGKGRGKRKSKGKVSKSTQSSRIHLTSMAPLLSASRLSAAAIPSSALSGVEAARNLRKREDAQTRRNAISKITIKRRERSGRSAGDASSSTSASVTDSSVEPVTETWTKQISVPGGKNGQQIPRSRAAKAVHATKSRQAPRDPISSFSQVIDLTGEHATPSPIEAISPKEASSTSTSVQFTGPTDADQAALGGDVLSSSASRVFPQLPLPKRINIKKPGGGFGAMAARGTKDRRWLTAEAPSSDNDDSSSIRCDSAEYPSDILKEDDEAQLQDSSGKVPGKKRRGRHKLQLSAEEMARRAVERRARNAFLARKRRASKRGIVVMDPSHHPLKKISIQCTAAPENTYIPDLPSSLVTLGMTIADARRARNAFLARVRRAIKRGFPKDAAIKMAAKPLPGDPERDTPVMKAQRAYMEQLEREAADEVTDSSQNGHGSSGSVSASNSSVAAEDDDWEDEPRWAAAL